MYRTFKAIGLAASIILYSGITADAVTRVDGDPNQLSSYTFEYQLRGIDSKPIKVLAIATKRHEPINKYDPVIFYLEFENGRRIYATATAQDGKIVECRDEMSKGNVTTKRMGQNCDKFDYFSVERGSDFRRTTTNKYGLNIISYNTIESRTLPSGIEIIRSVTWNYEKIFSDNSLYIWKRNSECIVDEKNVQRPYDIKAIDNKKSAHCFITKKRFSFQGIDLESTEVHFNLMIKDGIKTIEDMVPASRNSLRKAHLMQGSTIVEYMEDGFKRTDTYAGFGASKKLQKRASEKELPQEIVIGHIDWIQNNQISRVDTTWVKTPTEYDYDTSKRTVKLKLKPLTIEMLIKHALKELPIGSGI